jgi:hypothetical protein
MVRRGIQPNWPAGLLSRLLAALALPAFTSGHTPRTLTGHVVRVVYGDTIHVRFGDRMEKVRYIGVNAPELHHPTRGEEPSVWLAGLGSRTGETRRAEISGRAAETSASFEVDAPLPHPTLRAAVARGVRLASHGLHVDYPRLPRAVARESLASIDPWPGCASRQRQRPDGLPFLG